MLFTHIALPTACPQPAEADSWPLEGLRKVDEAPQSAANQSGMQRFESCHPSHAVRSLNGANTSE